MTSARFASAASIAATLIAVNWAGAHPEYAPTTVNRYLKIDLVSPTELRLAYTVLYGAGPALAARRAFDVNRDRRLDPAEARALGAALEHEVLSGLELTVDGRRVRPTFEPPVVGLAGDTVSPNPLSIDLIARIALPAGKPEHTVRVDDRTILPSPGETEIRIEESPATTLLAAHTGAGPAAGKPSQFLFRGPRSVVEDRSVTFRFR